MSTSMEECGEQRRLEIVRGSAKVEGEDEVDLPWEQATAGAAHVP